MIEFPGDVLFQENKYFDLWYIDFDFNHRFNYKRMPSQSIEIFPKYTRNEFNTNINNSFLSMVYESICSNSLRYSYLYVGGSEVMKVESLVSFATGYSLFGQWIIIVDINIF